MNKKRSRRIYLDYASATPLDLRVKKVMEPYFKTHFGNPGALHREGVIAKRAVAEARGTVARVLGAQAHEIIFTGSGTEANNLAIFGVILARERQGIAFSEMHAITSAVEHPSVSECFKELQRRGLSVSYILPDAGGVVSAEKILRAVRKNTMLISLVLVQSELGVIEPVAELGATLRAMRRSQKNTPLLHTDASQAALLLPLSVDRLGVDLMTLDAQKIYGPKGVGVLYRHRGVVLAPQIFGGGQEFGLRSSTENVPLIVGMARALTLASAGRKKEQARLLKLRQRFLCLLKERVPEAVINGNPSRAVPSTLHLSLPGKDAEMLVIALDARGVSAATKTACAESTERASAVVLALGKDSAHAEGSLRFSFGRGTTVRDVEGAVAALAEALQAMQNH